MLHHNTQELDDDLGGRSDEDLALATALSVADRVKRLVENADEHVCTDRRV